MSSSSSYSLTGVNSKLLRRIYRACRATLTEPNLALNLEICDYINEKQGNTPREAAITIVKLVNSKDPETADLALALLDNLVKNCGYPFHLQISRKEFLNELVKRFPERPPPRYTRTQRLILGAIEEWHQTICRTSRYKEDFAYVRDMHRLLSYKGYIFPEVKVEDAAVLNPSDNLKSVQELQTEEKIVHSAKLQELIRRGKPGDLKEANKLMKIMAGFKDDSIEESKSQVHEDLGRLKRKTEIFDEMLTTIQQQGGDLSEPNETIVELYSALKVSQPKITKIIEEDNENEEQVNELLKLNDDIHSLLTKYQLLRGGDVDSAAKVASLGNGAGAGDLNLIDFDDEPSTAEETQEVNDLLGDLSSLSFTNNTSNFGIGGSIALTNSSSPAPTNFQSNVSNLDMLASLGGSTTPSTPSGLQQSISAPKPISTNAQLDPFGFNFPSSTPAPIAANNQPKILINTSTNLKIEFGVSKVSANELSVVAFFSNLQNWSISDFAFAIAVPKAFKLDLNPQSTSTLGGYAVNGITQQFKIFGEISDNVKVKWKVNYVFSGSPVEESGISVLRG